MMGQGFNVAALLAALAVAQALLASSAFGCPCVGDCAAHGEFMREATMAGVVIFSAAAFRT